MRKKPPFQNPQALPDCPPDQLLQAIWIRAGHRGCDGLAWAQRPDSPHLPLRQPAWDLGAAHFKQAPHISEHQFPHQ